MKKILRCTLWIIGFLLFHFQGIAQSNVITGTVVAVSDNSPLPGVTFPIKGKNSGMVTDSEGKFAISDEPDEVLVFCFNGMETQEVAVTNSQNVVVSMAQSSLSLEEIVVVGYGTQKKANLTGAFASVDTKLLVSR